MTVYVAYIGPLRRTRRPRELKVDFTADEVIVAKPVKRPVNRMYSDEPKPSCKVLCYPLEEILAEKMRTVLQRTEPRDLYDVWRLLRDHAQELNLTLTKTVFDAKCHFKGMHIKSWDNFLTDQKVEKYQIAWQKRLADQVQELSPLKTVVRELKHLLKTHFV
jgi:predicted nucleotidyltransferase component of viral defense system